MKLANGAIHDTLRHVLVEHDRAEGRKASHNPYALGLYMEAMQSAMRFIEAGADVREVLIGHFGGRILDKSLKALRLAPATDREANGGGWTRTTEYAGAVNGS
jgi:hypothetical protein